MIEHDYVTADLFLNPKVQILEMNSKSGLYPLYLAYSLYALKLPKPESQIPLEETQRLWRETLDENIFVLCKTKMAVSITRRTLAGYHNDWTVHAVYLSKLLERMEDMPRLIRKLTNPTTWGKVGDRMKFDAIVGNPPYQLSGGSGGSNDAPIYQEFADLAQAMKPRYISLIIPSRWFSGGRENLLGKFRSAMLNNRHIREMRVFTNSQTIFPTVEIKGGLCYYLIDATYEGDCCYTLIRDGYQHTAYRNLGDFDVLIREPVLAGIVKKVMKDTGTTVESIISSDTPFGIPTNPKDSKKSPFKVYTEPTAGHNTKLYHIENTQRKIEYIDKKSITKNADVIDAEKVFIPKGYGAGEKRKKSWNGLTALRILMLLCEEVNPCPLQSSDRT